MPNKSPEPMPVITITGLPECGSDVVGREVAGLTQSKFVDDEILEEMSLRLRRSVGEIRALELSYRSWWSRTLRASVNSWERYAWHDSGFEMGGDWFGGLDHGQDDYLTEYQYQRALKGVIRKLAREGKVVMHGHGSHLFVPSDVRVLRVLVTATEGLRAQRAEVQQGLSHRHARKWLKRADRAAVSMFQHLLENELLDESQYDLVLNLEDMSYEMAAQQVITTLGFTSRQGGFRELLPTN